MSDQKKFGWFQPEDLPELFAALRQVDPPAILVGGQALNFWLEFLQIPIPETDTPFLTQDADIFASRSDVGIIASHLNKSHSKTPGADDKTPSNGFIVYYAGDRKLLLDVMGSLIGLNHDEIVNTAIRMDIANIGLVNVLHPRLLMISRISNLKSIESKRDTNGVIQARLSVQMYKAFLQWSRSQFNTEEKYQRFLMDKAKELKSISLSEASIFVYGNYGINVLESFPVESVISEEFKNIQWPKMNDWLVKKSTKTKGYS